MLAAGTASEVKRISHTEEAVSRLQNWVGTLLELTGQLEGRLSSVTRVDSPTRDGQTAATAVEPTFVPVAGVVREEARKVEQACERLSSILTRLEV